MTTTINRNYLEIKNISELSQISKPDKSCLVKIVDPADFNLNKFFYFNGRQAVIDIINFKIFTSNKVEKKLIKLLDTYKEKVIPTLPIGADLLMSKFQIPEGKTLGNKLKRIEETWVQNGFQISDKQVQQIVKS